MNLMSKIIFSIVTAVFSFSIMAENHAPHMLGGQGPSSPGVYQAPQPKKFRIIGDINLNMTRMEDFEQRYSFLLGVKGAYFFTPNFALSGGLQLNRLSGSREIGATDIDVSATYLDIPLGVMMSYGNAYGQLNGLVFLGVYYGLPTGKVEFEDSTGTVPAPLKKDADGTLGFELSHYFFFPVNAKIGMGLHTFVKYGFDNLVDDSTTGNLDTRYLSSGLGLGIYW